MTLNKTLGVTEHCPSCKKQIVCGEVVFKGESKLQWQDPTGGAHYSYDFKTKMTSCKGSTLNPIASPKKVFENTIPYDAIHLTDDQKMAIHEDTERQLNNGLARIHYIQEGLRARGIEVTGVFVGMLYNQQMENNRNA